MCKCRIFYDYQTNEKKEDKCAFCNKERDYNTASGFFPWLQNKQRAREMCKLMITCNNEYCTNKWMAVIFVLTIIVSQTIFYLWNGPLNDHVPFYEQMTVKAWAIWYSIKDLSMKSCGITRKRVLMTFSCDLIFSKWAFPRKVLSLVLVI